MRQSLLESVLVLMIVAILTCLILRVLWRPVTHIPDISPAWHAYQEDTLHPYE